MFQSTEFLSQVYSDLKGLFFWTRQGYQYYISFLEKSISFINVELLKFKDNTFVVFKNYSALRKRQSGCQLKIFYIDRGRKYIRKFDDYLKENDIAYEITAPYLHKQNKKAERVNYTIMDPI